MKTEIKTVSILVAVEDEALPFIESMGLKENTAILHPKLPMRCFQGTHKSLALSVVLSGKDERHQVDYIGSEASAVMAYETVTKLNPDVMISAGTAGGFAEQGADIGTVYLSDEYYVYHDRHVPIPGYHESAIGLYPAPNVKALATRLGVPTGIISTGSSLKKSTDDIMTINSHSAVAKEMEAAAEAWIGQLFSVPLIAVKSITNLVDHDNASEEEFLKNLSYASERLTEILIQLIDILPEFSVEDLTG